MISYTARYVLVSPSSRIDSQFSTECYCACVCTYYLHMNLGFLNYYNIRHSCSLGTQLMTIGSVSVLISAYIRRKYRYKLHQFTHMHAGIKAPLLHVAGSYPHPIACFLYWSPNPNHLFIRDTCDFKTLHFTYLFSPVTLNQAGSVPL